MTGSDSQNDRQIHILKKENLDSDLAVEDGQTAYDARPPIGSTPLTIHECLAMAENVQALVPAQPETGISSALWVNLLPLRWGISAAMLDRSQRAIGPIGTTLAIVGLVEAFGRVREPAAYLAALCKQAQAGKLDVGQMFRSLVRPAYAPACIPG